MFSNKTGFQCKLSLVKKKPKNLFAETGKGHAKAMGTLTALHFWVDVKAMQHTSKSNRVKATGSAAAVRYGRRL